MPDPTPTDRDREAADEAFHVWMNDPLLRDQRETVARYIARARVEGAKAMQERAANVADYWDHERRGIAVAIRALDAAAIASEPQAGGGERG